MASPMYRQIAEDLRGQIESGVLKPGRQLRSEGEFKEHYGASRNTVRDAIKLLTTLGLVETRPGQGTFVVKKMDPFVTTLTDDPTGGVERVTQYGEVDQYHSEVRDQQRIPAMTDPQVEILKASGIIAAQLAIPEGSHVISRHQRRYIDQTPWSLQTSFYPSRLAVQGAERLGVPEDIVGGTVKYLADTLGLKQMGYRDWIRVRTPDSSEAQFFGLSQDGGVAVFEIFRTAFDQTGKPIRLTITIFPTDRNEFIVNVGVVTAFPALAAES
jgi:GntR family transcriptional regulator